MSQGQGFMPAPAAVLVFLAFALAYFFSALVRAITATLAPTLSAEFGLGASDLGLLAGGYFLGFAITQLPLGHWLDRHGPKRVVLAFLSVAVLGCVAFASATGFNGLLAARVLTGMGVSACLMAPLTAYRRWFTPETQLRTNAWMLMTGSLGMVASTLPVQWLLPHWGWRGLFWGLAACVLVSMAVIAWKVPRWQAVPHPDTVGEAPHQPVDASGYGAIWRHAYFRRLAPLGFFLYGGMVAVQTLWAGPWMVRVTGQAPAQAATGLFFINLSMLCAFWSWGWLTPALKRRGWGTDRLITWGVPLALSALALNIALGSAVGWVGWAAFCVLSTAVSLSQPAVGLAFSDRMAGRALSAYNLVIFAGVFAVQWGIGLAIDALRALGWAEVAAFQGAFAAYGLTCLWAYGVFWRGQGR